MERNNQALLAYGLERLFQEHPNEIIRCSDAAIYLSETYGIKECHRTTIGKYINELEKFMPIHLVYGEIGKGAHGYRYDEDGCNQHLRNALMLQKAKTVKKTKVYNAGYSLTRFACPACANIITDGNYCKHCGQKLSWSE